MYQSPRLLTRGVGHTLKSLISLQDTSSSHHGVSSRGPTEPLTPTLCPRCCRDPARRALALPLLGSNPRIPRHPTHLQSEGLGTLPAQNNLSSLEMPSFLCLFCFMFGLYFLARLVPPLSKFLSSVLWSSWHLLPGREHMTPRCGRACGTAFWAVEERRESPRHTEPQCTDVQVFPRLGLHCYTFEMCSFI